MTTTYTSIEIIFDRDNGSRNEGWYARTTAADGATEDEALSTDWAEDEAIDEPTIRAWAMAYYCDEDGMNDAELQQLRESISIKR